MASNCSKQRADSTKKTDLEQTASHGTTHAKEITRFHIEAALCLANTEIVSNSIAGELIHKQTQ
jgi:hypothetical protein